MWLDDTKCNQCSCLDICLLWTNKTQGLCRHSFQIHPGTPLTGSTTAVDPIWLM